MWLDLEMTGLDPSVDVILQAAFGFTKLDLSDADDICVTELTVAHSAEALDRMSRGVLDMHRSSGLLSTLSSATLDEAEVEQLMLDAMRSRAPERTLILAGNSIWVDRMFLAHRMPMVERYLHYQQVDVTSVKLLAQAWWGALPLFHKEKRHTANADVRESVAELMFYRNALWALLKQQ